MITAIVLNRSGNIVKEIRLRELPSTNQVITLTDNQQAQVVEVDGNLVKLRII